MIEWRSDVVFYLEKNHDLRREQLRQCGVFFATDPPETDNKIDSLVRNHSSTVQITYVANELR